MKIGQFLTLLEMQVSSNALINPGWFSAGYKWMRAVTVEATEAMEHFGWKWWKKQEPDLEQFKIELVDILHFALSHAVTHHEGDLISVAEWLAKGYDHRATPSLVVGRTEYVLADMGVLRKLELMIHLSTDNRFSFPLLSSIMEDVGMTWDDMFIGYTSKNVLNIFRQHNGYKAGTYIKDWGGVEDNVVLSEIVKTLDISDHLFPTALYNKLRERYTTEVGATALA